MVKLSKEHYLESLVNKVFATSESYIVGLPERTDTARVEGPFMWVTCIMSEKRAEVIIDMDTGVVLAKLLVRHGKRIIKYNNRSKYKDTLKQWADKSAPANLRKHVTEARVVVENFKERLQLDRLQAEHARGATVQIDPARFYRVGYDNSVTFTSSVLDD